VTKHIVQCLTASARPHWGLGFDTRYECSEYFHLTATYGMLHLIHSLQDGFFSTVMVSVSVSLTKRCRSCS